MKKSDRNSKVWLDFSTPLKDFNGIPTSQNSIEWSVSDSEQEEEQRENLVERQNQSPYKCLINKNTSQRVPEKCGLLEEGQFLRNSSFEISDKSEASEVESLFSCQKFIGSRSQISSNSDLTSKHKSQSTSPVFHCRKRTKFSNDRTSSKNVCPSQESVSTSREVPHTENSEDVINFIHSKHRYRFNWTALPSSIYDIPKYNSRPKINIDEDELKGVPSEDEDDLISISSQNLDSERIHECIEEVHSPVMNFNNSNLSLQDHASKSTLLENNRGSSWIRRLQFSTPEKQTYSPSNFYKLEPPDSSKKKFKSDGFATRLEKSLQSWYSDYFMWNHQMSSILTSKTSDIPPSSDSTSTNYKEQGSVEASCEISSVSSKASSWKGAFGIPKKWILLKIIKKMAHSNGYHCSRVSYFDDVEKSSEKSLHNYNEMIVYFGQYDAQQDNFLPGDSIKVFAPWQSLSTNDCIKALFSSYFLLEKRADIASDPKGTRKKKTRSLIASWSCNCIKDISNISCAGGRMQVQSGREEPVLLTREETPQSLTFMAVKDAHDTKKLDVNRIWTIREALEETNKVQDKRVSVTLRIHRIIPKRKSCLQSDLVGCQDTEDQISHYLVIGQDPSGSFALIEIPNRPLISSLDGILNGIGATYTFTHLTVAQRITDAQDRDLFWLISSLEAVYQKVAEEESHLPRLLSEGEWGQQQHSVKQRQTFCYKFEVNLGTTQIIFVSVNDGLKISLPDLAAFENIEGLTGQRGFMRVLILYCVKSCIYVILVKDGMDVSDLPSNCEIKKVQMRRSFERPDWFNTQSPMIILASIQDCVIYRGNFLVDEYSLVAKLMSKELSQQKDIWQFVPAFSAGDNTQSIVSIHGAIERVKEDDALIWEVCPICNTEDLKTVSGNVYRCLRCKKVTTPCKRYQLKVYIKLDSAVHDSQSIVLVKLFIRRIEELLKALPSNLKGYNAKGLLGKELPPLVCLVQNSPTGREFHTSLTELPF